MDALPIVLALLTLNVTNPGRLLFGRDRSKVPSSSPFATPQQLDEEKPVSS